MGTRHDYHRIYSDVSSFPQIDTSSGADLGGFVGFEPTPLFADSFDLLVLCYSQLCLTLSAGVPVQFGYCVMFSVQFNSTCMQ